MSLPNGKSKFDPVLPDQASHSMRIDPQDTQVNRTEAIRVLAYQFYEQGGRQAGHDLDDWLAAEAEATDRNYWLSYSGAAVVGIADECLNLINAVAKNKRALNYNKGFIGLIEGNQANNFVYFRPRKSFLRIRATVGGADTWVKRLEESGLDASVKDDGLAINVTPQSFAENKALIQQMLEQAVKEDER